MKKTKMFLEQKSVIIDEENRIIRIKASTGDFDREQDRINPKGWKLSEYTIPFIDAHKSSGSYDGRLGEVVKGYEENGIWYNEVKLDKPSDENPNAWTDGEKLSNRVWNLIKEGKDISVSVGFLPDENGIKKNSNGGYDFQSQEQYELSIVLAPCNPKAGTKSMENLRTKTLDEVIKEIPELEGFIEKALNKETIPNTEIPLRKLLKDKLKEKFKVEYIYLCELFVNKVIVDVWNGSEYKYYEVGYTADEQANITLVEETTEVEPMEIWVKEKEMQETYEKTLKENLEFKKELETLKKVEEETPKIETKKSLFKKRGGENE